MEINDIELWLIENGIYYEKNISLKKKTWLKTGGIVSLWISPNSMEKLINLICYFNNTQKRYEIVGCTSNIYYLDSYNPYIIISTTSLKDIRIEDSYIECECGVLVSKLSNYCIHQGFKGFYGLINLPGTVGAALCNNSSCFECSLSELLIEVRFLEKKTNSIIILKKEDLKYSFRNSSIKSKEIEGVILSAKFSKIIGIAREEEEKAKDVIRIRKETQEAPAYTLGSIYAGLKLNSNFKTKCLRVITFLFRKFHLYSKKRYIELCLLLYGYTDLNNFVSKKNINTFIWVNTCDDKYKKFCRYQKFINSIYENPIIEIEIRGN